MQRISYKRGRCRAIALVSVLAAAAACCGNGGQAPDPADPRTGPADAGATAAGTVVGEALRVSRPPAPQEPPLETVFDLASNLFQGHLRSGGLLVDFGTPARHKHTLGDWYTGWRGDFRDGDTTFSYVSAPKARVFFDALPDEVGGGKITIRARPVGSHEGRVYLNGRQVGTAELSGRDWGYATVEVSGGIEAGPNEIMLRFGTRRPAHDGRAAALAVDYIRVVPAGKETGPAASSHEAARYPDPAGGPPGLALAAGESLTWAVPVPEGGVLRGEARCRGAGERCRLEARVTLDDGTERVVADISPGSGAGSLRADLGDLGGGAASITLAAHEGEVALSGAALAAPPSAGSRPSGRLEAENLVLVLIDTLRADHLPLYDERTRVRADYMDRLGAESMVFDRALAQENWTKPSVATLLTGLFPGTHRTKTEKDKLPRTVTMASDHFGRLGYETAAFVANGYISGKFGFRRGWGTWRNYVREGRPNRAKHVVDDAISWLRSRRPEKPFFLYVHTIDPHVPYIPPRKYWSLYDTGPYDGPVEPTRTAKLLERVKSGSLELSDRDKIRLEALYDGEITYHDDNLARLHDEIEAQGLLEDTLVVVTSDHGEEFFEHGLVGHGHSLYEELLHVPLVVRLPGARAGEGARSSAEVGLVDVLPTACEILGVEPPEGVEGTSLVPEIGGLARSRWPSVSFSDFLGGQRAARMGRFKLVQRGARATVFDLMEDPAETRDLSGSRPVTLAALRDLLGRHEGRFAPSGEVGGASPRAKEKHEREQTEIDPQTRRQLEELGYVGD